MTRLLLAALASTTALPALADVNVYTTRQPELIQPVIDGFTAATGIQVNLAFVEEGLVERLVAEGDRSPADLVMTVDIANLTQIVDAGVVQPVESAVLDAAVPQPRVGPVEQVVVDEEGVVLPLDLDGRLGELEQHPAVQRDVGERAPGLGLGHLEQVAVEARGDLAVLRHDDGVVERDAHGSSQGVGLDG